MNGVEILNETSVYVTQAWVNTVVILASIAAIVFSVIFFNSEKDSILCVCFICLLLCAATLITLAVIANRTDWLKEYSHTEYKVTIDDSVSMTEFLDKYEILDQEGKIYTVRERE